MNYFEHLEYQEMAKDPMDYFKNKKIINFDIIHHKSRDGPLEGSYKDYQSIKNTDLRQYLIREKKKQYQKQYITLNAKICLSKKRLLKNIFQTNIY